jgi:hypothetical protein
MQLAITHSRHPINSMDLMRGSLNKSTYGSVHMKPQRSQSFPGIDYRSNRTCPVRVPYGPSPAMDAGLRFAYAAINQHFKQDILEMCALRAYVSK